MLGYCTIQGKRDFLRTIDVDDSKLSDGEVISACCSYWKGQYKPKEVREIIGMKLSFAGLSGGAMTFETMNMFQDKECHVVYFFYGADNVLLYVGRTNNFKSRWKQHMQTDKDMKKIKRVCLHIFETKPETIFYEAQMIVAHQPVWNKAGLLGKMSKHSIEPVDIVWFDCNLQMTEKEFDRITESMELYYTDEWFASRTDAELADEIGRIHLMSIGAEPRPKHFVNPWYDNKGLS